MRLPCASRRTVGWNAGTADADWRPCGGAEDGKERWPRDPAAIEATGRLLPIGFWKGSGLALLLDMVAALLSGGRATHEIPAVPEKEAGLSQLFLALDPSSLDGGDAGSTVVDRILADLHAGEHVRHPGERTLETRRRSIAEGVPVDEGV